MNFNPFTMEKLTQNVTVVRHGVKEPMIACIVLCTRMLK